MTCNICGDKINKLNINMSVGDKDIKGEFSAYTCDCPKWYRNELAEMRKNDIDIESMNDIDQVKFSSALKQKAGHIERILSQLPIENKSECVDEAYDQFSKQVNNIKSKDKKIYDENIIECHNVIWTIINKYKRSNK